jgi:hypothetical protein
MAHDVFVSHSSKDKPIADAICTALEQVGIRCWIAPRDIVPGATWGKSIVDAIQGARVMVLVFSANANTSPQIEREVERAVSKGLPLIPFRIENVKPSGALEYFLGTPHWLDALTPPVEQHLQRLVEVIRQILAGPSVETRLEVPHESATASTASGSRATQGRSAPLERTSRQAVRSRGPLLAGLAVMMALLIALPAYLYVRSGRSPAPPTQVALSPSAAPAAAVSGAAHEIAPAPLSPTAAPASITSASPPSTTVPTAEQPASATASSTAGGSPALEPPAAPAPGASPPAPAVPPAPAPASVAAPPAPVPATSPPAAAVAPALPTASPSTAPGTGAAPDQAKAPAAAPPSTGAAPAQPTSPAARATAPAAKPPQLAARPPVGTSQTTKPARDVRRFDGLWIGSVVCAGTESGLPGWKYQMVATVTNGTLHGERGHAGQPGSETWDGTVRADGTIEILQKGLTGNSARDPFHRPAGTEFQNTYAGKLNDTHGTLTRLNRASCTIDFVPQANAHQ